MLSPPLLITKVMGRNEGGGLENRREEGEGNGQQHPVVIPETTRPCAVPMDDALYGLPFVSPR